MIVLGHGTEEPGNLINSRESFPIVRESGADGVELDVRLTADRQVVVIHDHLYPDGRAVARTPAAGRPADVALLAEALDLCRGLLVNIEIKNFRRDPAFDPMERLVDAVISLLSERAGADRVLVSCFGIAALDRVRELDPSIATAHLVLSRQPAPDVVGTCAAHGHPTVHPLASMVDEEFMAVAREHGLSVNAWTAFAEPDPAIVRLGELGVDGIITEDPQQAMRLLRGARGSRNTPPR